MTYLTIALALSLCIQSQESSATPSEEASSEFEAICLAYRANREAFIHGAFEFEYSKGRAKSDADALEGRFSYFATAKGLYVFDRDHWRYELNFAAADMARATSNAADGKRFSSLATYRVLSDGKVTLLEDRYPTTDGKRLVSRPKILDGTSMLAVKYIFPLRIGLECAPDELDLYSDLRRIKEGKLKLKSLEHHSELHGEDMCKAVLEAGNRERTIWIDVDRGSVPRRIEDSVTKSDVPGKTVIEYADLFFVKQAGWIPRLQRFTMQQGRVASELRITKIDVGSAPPPSMFRLEFTSAAPLFDRPKSLTYSPRKYWSLNELPSRNSPEARYTPVRNFEPPPEPASPPAVNSLWPTVAFAVSGGVFALVLLRIIRQRKRVTE